MLSLSKNFEVDEIQKKIILPEMPFTVFNKTGRIQLA